MDSSISYATARGMAIAALGCCSASDIVLEEEFLQQFHLQSRILCMRPSLADNIPAHP